MSNLLDNELIEKFIYEVRIENSTVTYENHHIVLCGGQRGKCIRTSEEHLSLRDHFEDNLFNKDNKLYSQLIIPEDFKCWSNDSLFTDLLEFETLLSSLAHTILLFAESVGSFIELGTFSYNSEMDHKLVIVANSNKLTEESFISLGPLKHLNDKYSVNLEEHELRPVLRFNWPEYPSQNVVFNDFESVYDSLKKVMFLRKHKKKINVDFHGDLIHLIADLVNLFIFISRKQLFNIFNLLSGKKLHKSLLDKIIYILYTASIINRYEYGNETYYYSIKNYKYIEYSGTKLDRSNFQLQVTTFYRENNTEYDSKAYLEAFNRGLL